MAHFNPALQRSQPYGASGHPNRKLSSFISRQARLKDHLTEIMRKLLHHIEGTGRLGPNSRFVTVRYCIDIWRETIPMGSGRSGIVWRADGFIWRTNNELPRGSEQVLELEGGQRLDIRVSEDCLSRSGFVVKDLKPFSSPWSDMLGVSPALHSVE